MVEPVTTGIVGKFVVGTLANYVFGSGSSRKQLKREAAAAQSGRFEKRSTGGRVTYWVDTQTGQTVSRRRVRQYGAGLLKRPRPGGGISPPDVSPPTLYPPPVLFPSGTDTTAARRRRGSGPGYRPSWWRTNPGWAAYKDCIRRGYDSYECEEYLDEAFVGPVPVPVKRTPVPVRPSPDVFRPASRVLAGARVLARILGPLPYIFWPSQTADDDTIPGPMPDQIPQRPKGPLKRPVIIRAPTVPRPDYPRQPRFPDDFTRPGTKPDILTRPAPGDFPKPASRPAPIPAPRPAPRPVTVPTPIGWPDVLPYLMPLMQPRPRMPTRPRFTSRPLTPPQNVPLQYPVPLLQARPANCPPCGKETKQRKKRKCSNPITSRRTFKRNGARYRTITRKLQCPV